MLALTDRMRRVWYQRVIRFWLVVLVPIAIYCAYQAYKSHTLIGAFQRLSDDWLGTEQRHEREETRGTFDARAEWRSAIEGRNRNIENRKFYIVSSALLLLLPLFAWVSAIALKWIWRDRLSEKATVPSMLTWKRRQSWVAVFDILGFGRLIEEAEREFPRALLTNRLDELLSSLDSEEQRQGSLDYLVFSDTIVIFASSQEPSGYPWFLLQCENLIKDSIRIRMPLRGAISVGTTFSAAEHPIVIGLPFVEAFKYCEDQDWIGLLLAPSATRALRAAGIDPLYHDFVPGPLPLRHLFPQDVLAYRFQNGMANFDSPLLPWLREMQHFAPQDAKEKYTRTIEHIQRHYRYVDG